MSENLLGAVLAGGRSRRFGAPKALAEVGGRAMVARVAEALRPVVGEVVLIANEEALYGALGLPIVPDEHPGLGPMAGVQAALRHAAGRGYRGALCVACDMPFVTTRLLEALARRAAQGACDAVAPAGADGLPEPLCAAYSLSCLGEIDARIARGELAMRALLASLRTELLPLRPAGAAGDPEALLLNVNTPEEHRRAQDLSLDRGEIHGG